MNSKKCYRKPESFVYSLRLIIGDTGINFSQPEVAERNI